MFAHLLACVASISVRFSARSRYFSLFGGTKLGWAQHWWKEWGGAGKQEKAFLLPLPLLAHFCTCLNFFVFKKGKILAESPTETLATQSTHLFVWNFVSCQLKCHLYCNASEVKLHLAHSPLSCYKNWVKLQPCGPLVAQMQVHLFTKSYHNHYYKVNERVHGKKP